MSVKPRRHWLEAVASLLLVGAGQLIKGEGKKGLLLLLTFYFTLPAIVYLTLLFNPYLFLFSLGLAIITGLVIWVYNIFDAFTNLSPDQTFPASGKNGLVRG